MPKVKPKSKRRILKGWGEIAEFLGQTVSVAQRWQNEGMPVTREGRISRVVGVSAFHEKAGRSQVDSSGWLLNTCFS